MTLIFSFFLSPRTLLRGPLLSVLKTDPGTHSAGSVQATSGVMLRASKASDLTAHCNILSSFVSSLKLPLNRDFCDEESARDFVELGGVNFDAEEAREDDERTWSRALIIALDADCHRAVLNLDSKN